MREKRRREERGGKGENPWASAFIGGQGGVHKQKMGGDFIGVFECH